MCIVLFLSFEYRSLVRVVQQYFLIFKQYYIYLYTFFYPPVFFKNINNITRTVLPNSPLIVVYLIWFLFQGEKILKYD